MVQDNYGSQNGDGGINIGTGDFRGANIKIGSGGKPEFTIEQLQIKRNPVLRGYSIKSQSLNIFGVVTGIASVVGLYFTLFQAFPKNQYSSWSTLFLFSLMVGVLSTGVAVVLRKRKFKHFLFRKFYLEEGTKNGLFLNSFTAVCPWCSSRMNLTNVGPKSGPRDDFFICERDPKHHTIDLDPTVLPEIQEL